MDSIVESCKKSAVDGMEIFLRNFSYVPEDKLTWQATPTAKSAIRIAAHTALYPARFAQFIRERRFPAPDNLDEWLERRNAEEAAITTRAEVEEAFRKGTKEFIDALDTLTPEDIASSIGSTPMTWVMNLAGFHATLHTGQIDFLQTCWDDQQVYV